jgi:hypothetical protein
LIYVQDADATMLRWFGWEQEKDASGRIALKKLKRRKRKMPVSVQVTAIICVTIVAITFISNNKKGK